MKAKSYSPASRAAPKKQAPVSESPTRDEVLARLTPAQRKRFLKMERGLDQMRERAPWLAKLDRGAAYEGMER